MAKRGDEFRNFDDTMTTLLKVTHTEIKEKLDAEKAAHTGKRGRPKKSESPQKLPNQNQE